MRHKKVGNSVLHLVYEFAKRNKTDEHHIKLAYSALSILNMASNADINEVLLDISKYWEIME